MNVLPCALVLTAFCRALPRTHCFQGRSPVSSFLRHLCVLDRVSPLPKEMTMAHPPMFKTEEKQRIVLFEGP